MTDASMRDLLSERLATLESRIQAACRRAGRDRKSVTLVAVTKTVSTQVARLLPGLGMSELGENRPQELWRKAAAVPQVHWHLIGHLQRNKIERTLPLVSLIHSVDSLRLLSALEAEAARQRRVVPMLLELNVSQEPSKNGFSPAELGDLVPHLLALKSLQLRGLMTMAAFVENPEDCRPTFVLLRLRRDWLQSHLAGIHDVRELSMGMTNDFEIAIEEGATLIRLGTALFEGLPGAET